MLNKETILALSGKRKVKKLHVKAWGGDVFIRGVSAGEMDHIEGMNEAYRKDPLSVPFHRATACAYFLSDESGKRMFGDDDIEKLNELPVAGFTQVFNAGLAFNQMASIEELEKNSETTPSDNSGTS